MAGEVPELALLGERSENIEDLRENPSQLFVRKIPNAALKSQFDPHNAPRVPGDVLPALADRLDSLTETKVAMTPNRPTLLPNGAPHPSPSEGRQRCQG